MAQFDTEIADGLWDGLLPADAPAWCTDVASLIGTARGPATEDELAGEDMIVSRMAEAILAAAADEAAGNPTTDVPGVPGFVDPFDESADAADDETADVAADVVPGVLPDGTTLDITIVASTTADGVDAPDLAGVNGTKVNGVKANGTKLNGTDVEAADDRPTLSLVPPADDTTDKGTPESDGDDDAGKVAALADWTPRHLKPRSATAGGLRLVRRMVAVKAVATTTAVAIGITAAAAATGVVVTVVDPPKWPASNDAEESTTLLPPEVTIDVGLPTREGEPSTRPRVSPVLQMSCILQLGCPNPAAILGVEVAEALTSTTVKDIERSDTGELVTSPSQPGTEVVPTDPATTATTEAQPPPTDPEPTTTTTEAQPPPTDPEPTTTTEAPPDTTTSTTDTTVATEPSAFTVTASDDFGSLSEENSDGL